MLPNKVVGVVRAYADDIAMALLDVSALDAFFPTLKLAKAVASLDLNKSKCTLIPLWA